MSKKQTKVEERQEAKADSSELITITNHQNCRWLVPVRLEKADLKTSAPFVRPLESIKVTKSSFDREVKGSQAFKAMLDLKLLVASKKVVLIDSRDLKSTGPLEPPEDLKDGKGKDKEEIIARAVTLSPNDRK